MTTPAATDQDAPRLEVFSHVVVGVDGTEPSFEACRQAARLAEPGSAISLVGAVHLADSIHAGSSAPRLADEMVRETEASLRAAEAFVGSRASSQLVNGPAGSTLRVELGRQRATLVAVGTHGHRRASEILLGGVAGELLHGAPCSVLIARPPSDPAGFPRSLIVGLDGSPQAEKALETAEKLAARFGATIRVVCALGGHDVDADRVRARTPAAEFLPGAPASTLIEAVADADLLVVGSRGLHGLQALGSVSERVAHRAPCSVLVVRPQAN